MNTTTENTIKHNSIFETKEQYHAFRAKWRQLYADGFHKKVKHEYRHGGHYERNPETKGYKYIEGAPAFYMASPLTVWHHLIFNLAIGRNPPTAAFGERQGSKYTKPPLYWNLSYSNWDYSVFGDTLTEAQIETLKKLADVYLRSL